MVNVGGHDGVMDSWTPELWLLADGSGVEFSIHLCGDFQVVKPAAVASCCSGADCGGVGFSNRFQRFSNLHLVLERKSLWNKALKMGPERSGKIIPSTTPTN